MSSISEIRKEIKDIRQKIMEDKNCYSYHVKRLWGLEDQLKVIDEEMSLIKTKHLDNLVKTARITGIIFLASLMVLILLLIFYILNS